MSKSTTGRLAPETLGGGLWRTGREKDVKVARFDEERLTRHHLTVIPRLHDRSVPPRHGIGQRIEITDEQPMERERLAQLFEKHHLLCRDEFWGGEVGRKGEGGVYLAEEG